MSKDKKTGIKEHVAAATGAKIRRYYIVQKYVKEWFDINPPWISLKDAVDHYNLYVSDRNTIKFRIIERIISEKVIVIS